jgi:dienelactone hydrolase
MTVAEPTTFPHRGVAFPARRAAAPGPVAPGVLLVHDAWGLDEDIADLAGRLADAGFTVLAPDVLGGRLADDAEQARALAVGLDGEDAVGLLASAIDALAGDEGVQRGPIAAVGIGMGALLATTVATLRPALGLVVAVGPVPDLPLEAWSRADADLVVLTSSGSPADGAGDLPPRSVTVDDDGESAYAVAALDTARAAGRRVDEIAVPDDVVEATLLATLVARLLPDRP